MTVAELVVHADTFELAHQATVQQPVRFEGVAVGTGVYTAQGGLQVRITKRHLPLIADRLVEAQIRDLHEERIEATVGVVTDTDVVGDDVRFTGEVALEPHATIIRRFPGSIRFSVGFRFSAEHLDIGADGVADLPTDFVIDHIALVGRGQDPDARLTKLLNRATAGLGRDGTTMDKDTATELRRQRDQALEAEKQARADLAKAETRLENTTEKLDAATEAKEEAEHAAEQAVTRADAARLDLERAKAGFATTIMNLELQAGQDIDLHKRQTELLGMDLGELDQLRLELAEAAVERRAEAEEDKGPATQPGSPEAEDQVDPATMDLEALSVQDTLRLGLVKRVL